MKKIVTFIFSLYLLASLGISVGFGAELFVWKQYDGAPGVIMPKKDNQTMSEAVAEYFKKIHDSKSLNALLDQDEIQDLKVQNQLNYKLGKFESLSPAGEKPRFIVVTNELRELFPGSYSRRINNVKKRLEAMGAEVYMLPVVHDATLPIHEARDFRKKIIAEFDAQLVLGGADIDPYLYGEKTTFAKSVIRHRDLSELKFVRDFIGAKKGLNFGICRGHQMCAVANHKKLFQDIQIETGASEVHLNGEHFIKIDDSSEIFSVFDDKKLLVNSLHHQAVIIPEGDSTYKVIASSFDAKPIVEGLEFKNGLGFTLQFHPELMFDETGDKIMKRYVDLTIKHKTLVNAPGPCRSLIKSFL